MIHLPAILSLILDSVFMPHSTPSFEITPIAPVPDGAVRPFWSVMITSYKRTTYLTEAIASVLAQDPGADLMQIEVVDDSSPGTEIEALVKTVGQGRVAFYRQPQNVGIYRNWNTCIERAYGHWVHILSDDDLVLPGFYETYRRQLETHSASVVVGQAVLINEKSQWLSLSPPLQSEEGILNNGLKVLSKWNQINTPAIVVARSLYEQVGGFTTSLVYTPDWEMWTRLAAVTAIAYVPRPYCLFRVHAASQTSKLALNAAVITDCLAAWQIIQKRLKDPTDLREAALSVNSALTGVGYSESRKLLQQGAYRAAILYAQWAFKFSPTLYYLANYVYVCAKSLNLSLTRSFSSRFSRLKSPDLT
jgi:Glycosyl transferase family 2